MSKYKSPRFAVRMKYDAKQGLDSLEKETFQSQGLRQVRCRRPTKFQGALQIEDYSGSVRLALVSKSWSRPVYSADWSRLYAEIDESHNDISCPTSFVSQRHKHYLSCDSFRLPVNIFPDHLSIRYVALI